MAEKEKFTTTLDGELLRRVKILAVNRRCSANILLEEAMEDLLRKYPKESYSAPYEREETASDFQAIHEPPGKYGKRRKK